MSVICKKRPRSFLGSFTRVSGADLHEECPVYSLESSTEKGTCTGDAMTSPRMSAARRARDEKACILAVTGSLETSECLD